MAGVPAGRLSIEIVAEIARLQQDLDKAKRAVKAASDDIAKNTKAANDNLSKLGNGFERSGVSAKQAANGMRNLAFQAQDLGVQLAMAANSGDPLKGVLMALIMQGPQIKDALSQTGQSAGQLAASFARAHPVITAVAAAAASAAAALGIVTVAMNSSRKEEIDAFKDSLGLTAKELKQLGDVGITVGDVFVGLWNYMKKGLELDKVFKTIKEMAANTFGGMAAAAKVGVAATYAAFVGGYQGIKAVWSDLPAVIGEAAVGAANVAVKAVNWLLAKATTMLNAWIGGINGILEMAGFGKIGSFSAPQLEQLSNPFSGAGRKAGQTLASAFSGAFDVAMGSMDKIGSGIGDEIFKAMKARVTKEAKEKGLLDDDAAKKAGARAGKKAADEFGKNFASELPLALLQYQQDITKALTAALDKADAENIAKFNDQVNASRANLADDLNEAARPAFELREQLMGAADQLERLGGLAGTIGGTMRGIATGDWSGIGGAAGGLMQMIANSTWKNDKGEWEVLGDKIFDIFKEGGPFAQTLISVFQGMGTGAAVSQVVGNGSTGSQIGGMIGGAIGQEVGKQVLTGVLGKLGGAAGPLGAIAGSILGSVIGGIFKKTPTGSVILNGANAVGTSGNGGRDASGLGTAVIDTLNKISSILGVSATGSAAVSIGMRGDLYKVDPTGRGRTKESDVLTFKDAGSAVMAAVKLQLEKGVFEGLSEGVKKFLLNGDLETQLGKFANFRSALDAADQAKDPQAYELKALDKARTEILDIASKVGASLEEVARLEEYYAGQRQEIAEKYGTDTVELERNRRALEIQIMELSGDAVGALTAARELEKAETDASLHVLLDRRNALQNEAAAAAKAQQVLDERRSLEEQYLRIAGGELALRERQLQAIDASNHAIQKSIWIYEDMQRVAGQRADLELRMAKATGNTKLVDQIEMANFLGQFDQSLHSMAMAVWEAEKAAEAAATRQANRQARDQKFAASQEALAERFQHRAQAANDNLNSSLQETIDKFRGFSDELRKFRDGLYLTEFGPQRNFGSLRAQYNQTAMLAGRGDEKALAGLSGIAREYLDAAKMRASTRLEYESIVAGVIANVNAAIGTSDGIADHNQALIDAQNRIADGIEALRDEVKTLHADNASLREEVRAGNVNQKKTADALTDSSRGAYLQVKVVA